MSEGTVSICGAVDPATVTVITSVNPDFMDTPPHQKWCRCDLRPNHDNRYHACSGWEHTIDDPQDHPAHSWPVTYILLS